MAIAISSCMDGVHIKSLKEILYWSDVICNKAYGWLTERYELFWSFYCTIEKFDEAQALKTELVKKQQVGVL